MPVYDWNCPKCGRVNDVFASIAEEKKQCPHCGSIMSRLFSPSRRVNPDYQPYVDENLGPVPVLVKSRRHRKELMKRAGLVEVG